MMVSQPLDLKALAKFVADEIYRKDSLVVSARDIAFMLGYAPDSNPLRRILADPTFPHSLSLVDGGSRKYLRKEVEAWVQQKFADDRDTILRAHRAA